MSLRKLLFYLIVTGVIIYGQFFANQNLVTGIPPEIAAQTITGAPVADQISKGPGIIYFWAEWCGICRTMQGSISALLKEYPGVTVAMQSGDSEEVLEYLQKADLSWKTVADQDGSIGSRYGIRGVPAVFILGKDGQIKFTSAGYSSETGLRFRLWLAGL